MSPETQRGVAQALIALSTLSFALGMVTRAFRMHGLVVPTPWPAVVGMYLTSLGVAFGAHTLYWLGWWDVELNDPVMLAVLWLAAAMSVWAFVRWVRDER